MMKLAVTIGFTCTSLTVPFWVLALNSIQFREIVHTIDNALHKRVWPRETTVYGLPNQVGGSVR